MRLTVRAVSVVLLGMNLLFYPQLSLANTTTPLEVSIFFPTLTTDFSSLSRLENDLAIHFTTVKWYLDWSDPFTLDLANQIQDHGAIPDVTWQPQINGQGIPYSNVLAGTYDSYLDTFATNVKQFNAPLRIALAPEMNTTWAPWGINKLGNTSESHKAFWQYVVTKFKQAGVTNVQWLWSPNIMSNATLSSYKELYPGDDYVTFVGLDGYNWGTTQPGSQWHSFSALIGPSYNELTQLTNKKIIINETASTEVGGNKAEWITRLFTDILVDFPQIQGVTWFNMDKETDWRINSSLLAQQAFIKGAHSLQGPQKKKEEPKRVMASTINATPSTVQDHPVVLPTDDTITILTPLKPTWTSYTYSQAISGTTSLQPLPQTIWQKFLDLLKRV